MVLRLVLLGVLWGGLVAGTGVPAGAVDLVSGDDYAPFSGKDLPGGGLATALVRQAFAQEEVSVSIDFRPWQFGYRQVQEGDYDATYPYIWTQERNDLFLYSDPLISYHYLLFSSQDNPIEAARMEDLTGLRVCLPVGWALEHSLAPLIAAGQLVEQRAADVPACLRRILAGQSDFIVLDTWTGPQYLRQAGLTGRMHRSQLSKASILYLIVPRSRPKAAALIDRFNKGLERLRAQGGYDAIIKKYRALY